MTHIALPNGTVINVKTIVSVKALEERISNAYPGGRLAPSVAVVYCPAPSQVLHEQIACDTYQDAVDLRDRIIARLNEHTPIIPV